MDNMTGTVDQLSIIYMRYRDGSIQREGVFYLLQEKGGM